MRDEGLSTRQMAAQSNTSQTAIRYWLQKHNIKSKIAKFNKTSVEADVQWQCTMCGETDPSRFYKKKGRCKNCHNSQVMDRVKSIKKKAVEWKGGACVKCGYNRNYASLDFHHVEPESKDVNFKTSRHWSWERLKEELENCILVCKNCHAEIHHPEHHRNVG